MVATTTLFAALCTFFINHSGDIASKMAASAGYDILKKSLDFKGLSGKIKGFFKRDEDPDKFIERVCNHELPVGENPEPVLQSTFETLTGESFPFALLGELKSWFEESKEAITQTANVSFSNTTGFNVGAQQAKGNIYNIQGNYNVGNGKKEN